MAPPEFVSPPLQEFIVQLPLHKLSETSLVCSLRESTDTEPKSEIVNIFLSHCCFFILIS